MNAADIGAVKHLPLRITHNLLTPC